MSDASDKRYVSLPYLVQYGPVNNIKSYYGAMTARVGLFKALFEDGADLVAGCNKTDKTVTVKSHTRTRTIGSAPKTIPATTYDVEMFPRKNVSFGKGGEEYKVLVDGSWWGFRISGKQSTFHSFLCSNRSKLKVDMHYKSQAGASYFVNKTDG